MSNAEFVKNIHEFLIRIIYRLIKTKSENLIHKLGRYFAEIPKNKTGESSNDPSHNKWAIITLPTGFD